MGEEYVTVVVMYVEIDEREIYLGDPNSFLH